jgi:protein-S-isoprenylcysteine O-methyltransferase Ste14
MRIAFETIIATIIVPVFAILGIPYFILNRSGKGWPLDLGVIQVSMIAMGMLGMVMIVWVSYAFVTRGKGTPIPFDPPTDFVASGAFRFVRNPMYVGVITTLLSETVFFGSVGLLIYTCLLWLTLHIFLVVFEEPQLKRRFGGSYEDYLKSTPRWIPRLPARGRDKA